MDSRRFLLNGSLTGLGLTAAVGWSRTDVAVGPDAAKNISYADTVNDFPLLDLEEIIVMDLQKKML